MGIFEGITHSEEIQELLNDAQIQYDKATRKLENQKKRTTACLEELGRKKVYAWSKDMNGFLQSFGAFNNTQMVCVIDENYEFLGKNETPAELVINMQNASCNANEIMTAILFESKRQIDDYEVQLRSQLSRFEVSQKKMMEEFLCSFNYNLETGENYDEALKAIVGFANQACLALKHTCFEEFSNAMKRKEVFVLE